MTTKKPPEDKNLPKTWSSDDGATGINPPAKTDDRKHKDDSDSGIPPDQLTTENDQGAG